jgi:hypothetical protein
MDAFLESSLGIPEIDCTLSIQPELRRVAKQTRKPKSHLALRLARLCAGFKKQAYAQPWCKMQRTWQKTVIWQRGVSLFLSSTLREE